MRRVVVTGLGLKGDGVVEGESLHIPFALPGEVAEVDGVGNPPLVHPSSPDRVAPFCRHFGRCGGCRMQHMAAAPYQAWKRGIVETTLARARLETEVAPLIPAHGEGRRRVILHLKAEKGAMLAGFMVAGTHELIDLETCPVLVPALKDAPAIARAVARPLARLGKPMDVQLTATAAGIDCDIRGTGKIDTALRLTLSETAARLGLARLSLHGDVVVERRAPLIPMGRALVNAPPGGFLQATAAGEEALATLVEAAVGKAKKVLDLFCGAGPFALRLAERRAVTAYDSDRPAIEALLKAARATPGLKAVNAEARDLFRRPLLAPEIAGVDTVVLDPARAGAEAQVRQLLRAPGLKRIVYVSCDPGSFARDTRLLVDAGWQLVQVTPVDQFAFSAHVELVGVFAKG